MGKILYIDADTVLYSSAAQEQKLKCLARHIKSGREKVFESKTLFNEWIATQDKFAKEDFEFDVVQELVGEPRFAFQNIKRKIEKIVAASGCEEYFVCIQGKGNHRDSYQTPYVNYKGQRTAKPLLYQECFDFVLKKYKDNVIVSSGEETDDVVCQVGWSSYKKAHLAKSRDKADCIIAYCDKDIPANTPGWLMNYNKLEEGIFWNSPFDQSKKFWIQTLMGDNADNILGIQTLDQSLKDRYGVKTKGVGPTTAEAILKGCKSEKDMIDRVVEAYTLTHPTDGLQRLQDNAFFLYLKRTPNDVFNLKDYCIKRGVII